MAAMILDKLGKVFNRTRALVCDRLILLAGAVKLDGGEAGDVIGDVVICGIDLAMVTWEETGANSSPRSSYFGARLGKRGQNCKWSEIRQETYALQWPHHGA